MQAKTKLKATSRSKAVTPHKTGTAVAIRTTDAMPSGVMSTIIALAKDKTFSADKMKAMIEVQTGMMAQQAKINFIDDFHRMQEELPEIDASNKIIINKKGTNDVIQTTYYADFPSIMRVVKPILQRNHFTLNFTESDAAAGRVTTTAILANTRGGHILTSTKTLPFDPSGSKNDTQGYGSASSYNKRYLTIGIINLTTRAKIDRDDDAVIAGNVMMAPITDKQHAQLQALIDETEADVPKLCQLLGVDGTKLIRLKDFDTAIRLLSMKSKKKSAS